MNPDAWKPVFDFLEQEARFQAGAAAVTGAAAAWWLKTLLAPAPGAPQHPMAARIAAALLAISSFLFLVDQGRLSKKYGDLARLLSEGHGVPTGWADNLVRDIRTPTAILQWLPYYAARGLLFVVGALVVWMLFSRKATDIAPSA